ncbi:MAG: oligosaccharide flippase family protein [Chloroflexi bacterium]|nr:oligosaccharide flippase family protein [Chloroflexota bacterium]
MRRRLPDIAIVLLLLLLPLILFWQQTVGGKTLLPADNLYQYQPYAAYRDQVGAPAVPYNALVSDLVLENFQFKSFIRQSIAQGEFPLWNPYQFSGIPFFAAGQQSTLYPFSVIYYVLPLAAAYGWFMVSQLWLAGIFMFLFARGLGLQRTGSLIAGVVYQLSAFFVISAVFPMIVAAAVWLPLILLMIEFIIRQQVFLRGRPASIPWLAIGAGALGCCVLAGHVEITYYTLLVSAYYAAARLIYRWWRARHASPLRDVVGRGLFIAAMLALGMGLGAIQFIPTLEAAQNNFRTDSATLSQVLEWAHPKRDLIQFLMPNFYGNPSHHGYLDVFSGQSVSLTDTAVTSADGKPLTTIDFGIKNYAEGALYVGILPLALALYGLIRRRTVHQIIMALLGLASLTFMFGLPTYALLYILPGINQLHSPFRWVFPLTLCIALLAGFGIDSLLDSAEKWAKRFGIALVAIGALTLISLLASRLFYPQIAPLVERVLNGLAKAPAAFSDARMFYSYEAVNVLLFGVMILLSGLVFLFPSLRLRGRGEDEPSFGSSGVRGIFAVLLIAADLMIASYSFNPAADPALLDYTPPAIAWLQNQPGEWRYTTLEDPTHANSQLFNANLGMRYGLRDIRGYESIIPKAYVDLMQKLAPQVQLEYNRIAPIYTGYNDGFDPHKALTSPILDLLGVRYVISDTTTTIEDPGYKLTYEDKAVRIWQRMHAAPLIQAVSESTVKPQVTLTGDSGREKTIEIIVSNPLDSALVVSETYSPGWRAYVRPQGAEKDQEQQAALAPYAGDLQQIQLPGAGSWTVRLVYSPQSFQLGMFTSFIAAVLIVLALGIWLWRLIMGAAHEANATVRVARNSVAPIILNLFNRGIDFMFAVVMLRILGPTDSGWYFYAGVIFVWFDIFTNFGLNLYLTREVSRDRSKAAHIFFNTSSMRIGLAILGVPLLLGFLSVRQATVTPPINDAALIAILILYIGLLPNSLSTGLTALYYAFERAEVPATVATVATINKAVLGLLVLLGGFGIIGLAAVSIVSNVLTLALLLWNGRDMLRTRNSDVGAHGRAPLRMIDLPMIRMMAGESWFLMLNHFLATIFFQIDVILIEPFHGAKMVGQYSVAYKWISALNIIPSFFTQALLPVMSRQAHSDREGLKRNYILAIKLLLIVALPVAVAFTFMAYTLVGLLGGSQFLPEGAIATQIMIWSIPIGWMNSLTQYVLIAVDMHRRITRAFVIAVAFNIIANLLFIPQYGFQAAAVITIFSEAVLLIPFARLLHEALGSLPWVGMIWRPIVASAAMLLVLGVGWTFQPVLALIICGLVYIGVLLALRPLSADEFARLLPLLPSRLRRAFA